MVRAVARPVAFAPSRAAFLPACRARTTFLKTNSYWRFAALRAGLRQRGRICTSCACWIPSRAAVLW